MVTLVTGGASGLGRATVNRFAKKGSNVVFCDLPTSNGAEVAKEIGENVHYIPADVTSETDIQNVLDEIKNKHGKLDVLVNCAGMSNAFVTYNFYKKKPTTLEYFQKVFLVCWHVFISTFWLDLNRFTQIFFFFCWISDKCSGNI